MIEENYKGNPAKQTLEGIDWEIDKSPTAEEFAEFFLGKHYKGEHDFDVIDFCKAYDLNFNRGNIVKYVARAGKKDDELQDLKKALDYLKREIKYLES